MKKLTPDTFIISRPGAYSIIFILGVITWINPASFFWRDDWYFLSLFLNHDFSLVKGELASDVKPLFQYVLYLEFFIAGSQFFLYQLVNVIVLILSALIFHLICVRLKFHPLVSLASALIFLLHPTNFVNVLWIGQQAELLHLFFLLLSIFYFLKYVENTRKSTFILFLFFVLIQNYFFPNGVFMPLMFLSTYLIIIHKKNWNLAFIISCCAVFLFHVVRSWYIQRGLEQNTVLLFDAIPEKILYFITLISISIWRLLIPNFQAGHHWAIDLAGLYILLLLLTFTWRKAFVQKHKQTLTLGITGLLISPVILTLTRYQQVEIHYYYTSLLIIYICLLVAIYLDQLFVYVPRFSTSLIIVILILFIFVDNKGKRIFALRNMMNITRMEEAVNSKLPYVPFDDPSFKVEGFLDMKQHKAGEMAVILYQQLKADEEK